MNGSEGSASQTPFEVIPVEALIRQHTGRPISQRAFERQQERCEAIRKRLEMLAHLGDGPDEKVVTPAMTMKNTISLVGLLSGESFEAIRLLFAGSAERSRKDTLHAFAYFLRKHPGCRHMIVTCGAPVELERVPETLRGTCDRIRRLRSCRWFQEVGEVVMRSAEFSITREKYHCHVHIVIRPWVETTEEDWIELAHKLQVSFASVVLDDKVITDEYGAGQYLFNGNEIINIDPFDLCRLQDLMKHVRTHEPLGSFRAFCSELRSTKTKIVWSGNQLVPVKRIDGSFQHAPEFKDQDEVGRAKSKCIQPANSDADRHTNRLLRITAPFRPRQSRERTAFDGPELHWRFSRLPALQPTTRPVPGPVNATMDRRTEIGR